MTALLFSLLLIVTIATLCHRRWRERRAQREWTDKIGRSPENPLVINRFNQIDDFVLTNRCRCGGISQTISEGTRTFNNTALKVVKAECIRCEEELYFFFQIDTLVH